MTTVLCAQLTPRLGDLHANRKRSVAAIEAAARRGADVIVLPELVTSGYMLATPREAASVAIGPSHPLFDEWAAAAGGAIVVGGFCEHAENGALYNSAAIVDASGVLDVYRKTHLWDRERLLFTPGSTRPPVVETAVGKLGVLVCYDLEFPELTRALALAGAELITVPTNWPRIERPTGERAPEVIIAMAAARVNRVAIACCDRAGRERGQDWNEATSIVGPEGWVVAASGEDGIACADLALSESRSKRLTERADLFADRRPELYHSLTASLDEDDR